MSRTVLVAVGLALVLAGCSGGDESADDATSSPATSSAAASAATSSPAPSRSTTSEPPPAASPELPQGLEPGAGCQPLDPQLQTAIETSLRDAGSTLAAAQMVASPDGTVYAGGDVLLPDGTRESEADVWAFPVAGQALFSVSEGAIALSGWPDGRDALGVSSQDETGIALVTCIAVAR